MEIHVLDDQINNKELQHNFLVFYLHFDYTLSHQQVMETIGDVIDVHLYFIVDKDSKEDYGYSSSGGSTEVRGDLIELCALRLYPDYRIYMPFFYCMGLKYRDIPYNAEQCAFVHGLDYDKLSICASSTLGRSLLDNSYEEVTQNHIVFSPTLIVDGRVYSQSGGRTPENYVAALCYLFDHPTREFPWWIFSFMGSLILAVLIVVFVAKRWNGRYPSANCFRNFAFGNGEGNEALRRRIPSPEEYDTEYQRTNNINFDNTENNINIDENRNNNNNNNNNNSNSNNNKNKNNMNRKVYLQPISALSGSGVSDGLRWLLNNVNDTRVERLWKDQQRATSI